MHVPFKNLPKVFLLKSWQMCTCSDCGDLTSIKISEVTSLTFEMWCQVTIHVTCGGLFLEGKIFCVQFEKLAHNVMQLEQKMKDLYWTVNFRHTCNYFGGAIILTWKYIFHARNAICKLATGHDFQSSLMHMQCCVLRVMRLATLWIAF